MAERKADRKRKGKAVSSSSQVVLRFKTFYHESHFNATLSARRILPELIIQADENVFNPIRFQIHQRKWEKFTSRFKPLATLWSKNSMLMLGNQKRQKLLHFNEDLCEVGADWVRHRDGRPQFLRRFDLEPMTKGWYKFICRSILPTTNRSELTVERAVLIHSIIIGENINAEEIIAEQIYRFVYKTDTSSSLPFPSIIAALCADARIPAFRMIL
ncbi:hypothetical protein PIB30_057216 [Stylosanthes scabra]|uniref:Putative plant transposon protein domain-containing protein n=1 Tax=Stylosanthes scabra TaxID=79078 RepID=A0ABU6XHK6_9FABA|nr:hypothetical protein [Stylosanthes scabra]